MPIPMHFRGRGGVRLPMLTVTALCFLLSGCAAGPQTGGSLNLERPTPQFNRGRVTVVLVDEYGINLPGMRVDMSWDEPNFYKTSAFTNRQGEVTFSGIPDVAEVSVNHPGGIYTRVVLVPQSGQPELRVTLDTLGGGELMRQQERDRLAPPTPRSAQSAGVQQ
jgi:hypothetical protein